MAIGAGKITLELTRDEAMTVRLALVGCIADSCLRPEQQLVDPHEAAAIRSKIINQMY